MQHGSDAGDRMWSSREDSERSMLIAALKPLGVSRQRSLFLPRYYGEFAKLANGTMQSVTWHDMIPEAAMHGFARE